MSADPNNHTRVGILISCVSFLLFTLMDTILRSMGTAATAEKFFFLTLAASLVVFLFGTHGCRKLSMLHTHHPVLHGLRSIIYIVRFTLVIYCLPYISLTNFFSLIFTGPLFVTAFSALFLKETVSPHCWMATAFGFCGVIIDLRPTGDFDLISLFVLVVALLNSVDIILIRFTGREDSTAATAFYVQVLSLVPAGIYMVCDYHSMPMVDVGLASLAGLLSGLALMTLIVGYRMASTPIAAPFNYTQLIWGIIIDWYIWHDVPDIWTWVGGAMIIGSGLYILHWQASATRIKGTKTFANPLADD